MVYVVKVLKKGNHYVFIYGMQGSHSVHVAGARSKRVCNTGMAAETEHELSAVDNVI